MDTLEKVGYVCLGLVAVCYAVAMFAGMIAIFPYLDVYYCIGTKWCRNLGFMVTYSALLMKTWRYTK